MANKKMIISGFGGQGIVAAGRAIAYAGMVDGSFVSMLPSYGPEMRGGSANCHVILSDAEIASPLVSGADAALVMSLPAMLKFEPLVKRGGTLIVDSFQIDRKAVRGDISVVEVPATKIAGRLGNVKFANMVMLGALMSALGAPSYEAMTAAVRNLLPAGREALIPLELEALRAGINYRQGENNEQ